MVVLLSGRCRRGPRDVAARPRWASRGDRAARVRRGPRRLRIAVGVGRGVAALQAHLMWPLVTEVEEEVGVEGHPTGRVSVELDHPALDALGIELRVPGQVEGVGDIDAAAIAADLDHLRSAVERLR